MAADAAHPLARRDIHAILHYGEGVPRQMPVESPEHRSIHTCAVLEDDGRAVVERECIVDDAEHAASERRVERRSRFEEDVDAEMLRAPLGRRRGGELIALVDVAVLAIEADGEPGVLLCHAVLQPGPIGDGILGVLHSGGTLRQRQQAAAAAVKVDIEHGGGLAVIR